MTRSRVREDGALVVGARTVIPASEVDLRVTTSSGPGGQHANRSLTRVVASFPVAASTALREVERERLLARFGPTVRSSASRFRSQGQNRVAALEQLATRIAEALVPPTPRRATTPSASSRRRRVEEKRARGQVKVERRRRDDD